MIMKLWYTAGRIMAGIAAAMMTAAYCPLTTAMAESLDEPTTEAITETTETDTTEAETQEKLSSVSVIHTAKITDESYEPTSWWKADLDEYDDMSLVSYETIGGSGAKAVEFIAEGHDDSIISNSSTPSAVSETDEGTFAFTSYGWGHCVGLSQNGANFYAMYAGWNYQDILFHYYPGTTLMNTGTAETEIVTTQGVPGNVLQQVAEIVNCEVGPSFHPECIKAQAVAVYTYMKYHNNDAHDLKGKPDPPQELVDLCAEVLGEALYYNGDFCLTMFYASCGGITANCYDVFTADIPYLRSVSSEYDATHDPHWGDVTYYTVDEVRSKIQSAYSITLSSNPENWIKIVEGNGGYANQVIIDDQVTVRGNAFRSVMGLKSPKFTYICNVSQSDEIATEPNEDEIQVQESTEEQTVGAVEVVPEETLSAPTDSSDESELSSLPVPPLDDTLTAPPLDTVLFG